MRVAVITSSRADFGHLHWPLRHLLAHPRIETKLIVMGAHLSPEFGSTGDEIRRLGFVVDETIECLLSSDTDVGMSKSIGLATLGLSDCPGRDRPEPLLKKHVAGGAHGEPALGCDLPDSVREA